MTTTSRLGRGLESLLANSVYFDKNNSNAVKKDNLSLLEVPIEYLRSGKFQPRRDFANAALTELAESIKKQGIIQPIIVRKTDNNNFEIIAGERRWRAAQLAGLTEVPVVIKDLNDRSALAIALIENIQREDLNPLEEATALKRLLDEFSMTHQEVADAIGKSRTAVTNILRLLNLTQAVKKLLANGSIEMGHARALLALPDSLQAQAAEIIIQKQLSVREAENLARSLLKNNATKKTIKSDTNIYHLQNELSEKLGAKVSINHLQSGKGKLIIHYHSLDQLDEVLKRIQ